MCSTSKGYGVSRGGFVGAWKPGLLPGEIGSVCSHFHSSNKAAAGDNCLASDEFCYGLAL